MSKVKVTVLGLDGCSWKYLNKLVNGGTLPILKSILIKGFRAYLRALPPSTPPSWSSILTGVNPGKHGIFDFLYFNRSTYKERLTTSLDLEHPRIHEMLSMLGMKSIMINPIPSYPLIKVSNSLIIAHKFFTPKIQWFPERIKKYVSNLLSLSNHYSSFEEALEYAINDVNTYLGLINDLINKEDWNLLWLNLNYPDSYLHLIDDASVFKEVATYESKLFSLIDKLVKIMSDSSDYFILVSDHGFDHFKYVINVNTYLHKLGLAKLASEGGLMEFWEHMGASSNEDIVKVPSDNLLIKFILNNRVLRKLANPIKRIYEDLTGKRLRLKEYSIDPKRSDAFLLSAYSHGIIVMKEELVSKVVNCLRSLEGIANIYLRKELFSGPFIDRGADVYVEPNYGKGYTLGSNKVKGVVIREKPNNNHHPNGVLLVYGEGIKKVNTSSLPTVPNYIVTNLILALMGKPLPHIADGINYLSKVLHESVINSLRFKDYLSRWRIIKKLSLLSMK